MHSVAESRTPVAATAPPRKALYLATRAPTRVTAQAESLVVRRPSAADRRFPIARIGRIVCNRNADWSGEALALCLARGLTITWISACGDALGQCTPRLAAPAQLQTRIEDFLELPDCGARYGHWLRGRRMRVLVGWAAARKQDGEAVATEEWEQRKRDYVYQGSIPAVFGAAAQGWCHACVVSQLRQAGLAPRYWGYDAQPLELAEDLAGLLWAEINLTCGTLLVGEMGEREQMLFFENWAHLHGHRTLEHLAQLHRFVAREAESWL